MLNQWSNSDDKPLKCLNKPIDLQLAITLSITNINSMATVFPAMPKEAMCSLHRPLVQKVMGDKISGKVKQNKV